MAIFLEKELDNVEESKENINKSGQGFNEIYSDISSMNHLVILMYEQLKNALARQEQIKDSLTDVVAVSEENTAGIEQVKAFVQQF